MKVVAFMCVYNEIDILEPVLLHLHNQGVRTHVIDNWSNDGSYELAKQFDAKYGLEDLERFPRGGPSAQYSWDPLLRHVELRARQTNADWCMHHDADEIRRSHESETLVQAFDRVDRLGFNAVNFQVYAFCMTDDLYAGDPETHFKYYDPSHVDCNMLHIKAWKQIALLDLHSSGGHEVTFPGIRVYPQQFVLKHYPLRSVKQAQQKVIVDRVSRYDPAERAKGWHVQYDALAKTRNWIRPANDLCLW